MRALVVSGPGNLTVATRPPPTPRPDEAVVTVAYGGIRVAADRLVPVPDGLALQVGAAQDAVAAFHEAADAEPSSKVLLTFDPEVSP